MQLDQIKMLFMPKFYPLQIESQFHPINRGSNYIAKTKLFFSKSVRSKRTNRIICKDLHSEPIDKAYHSCDSVSSLKGT